MKLLDRDILRIDDEVGSVSLIGLMIPQLFELLFVQLLGTVNTVMLSRFSETAVAAVGVANQVIGMLVILMGMFKVGATIFVSISFGASRRDAAYNAAGMGVFWSVAAGVLAGVLFHTFATPVMHLMKVEGETLFYASEYFRIRMAFIVMALLANALLSFLRCNGHSVATFVAGVTQNAVNLALSYLVIFQPFPFPLKGVTGIAFAAVISQAVGLLIALFSWKKYGFPLIFRQSARLFLKIIRVGAPGATSSISYAVSQVVSTAVIVSLGDAMVAAKIYFSNIFFYVHLFSLSLGLAGAVMIGRLVGHRDYGKADRLYKQNLKMAIGINVILSLLVFLFGKPLLGLFTQNPEITRLAGAVMLIDILVEAGRAMNHIGENALNGAGDVVPPMAISMTACWGISVLFSYLLGVRMGWGLVGCWVAFMADEIFRGCFYLGRWLSGKWKAKSEITA